MSKYYIDKTIKNKNKRLKENKYDFIIYCHSSNILKANSSIIYDKENNIIKETYLGKKDYTYSFLSNILCDFKTLKEEYNNYRNGKLNILIISNEDVINKVLNLTVCKPVVAVYWPRLKFAIKTMGSIKVALRLLSEIVLQLS